MVTDKNTLLKYMHRVICITLSIVLVLALGGCSKKTDEREKAEENVEEDISIYGDPSLGIDAGAGESLRNYRLILLGGIDNGNRSDIMLVLCINRDTDEIKMFTVNRDTYMQIASGETVTLYDQEFEFHRCNEAYCAGGKYALMKELNEHLDLNIKEFIGVDWATTAKFIDLIGGVDCDIESQSMLDAINGLIESNPEGERTPIAGTGKQTLTGWQTVQYLRVRKYKGGNPVVRDEHNRKVVEELFRRAKTMSMEEISAVYDEIADDIDTNMSRNTLTDTFALLATTDLIDAGGWPYEYKVKWEPGKQFEYKVPQSLYSNVVQLHENVFGQSEYLPSAKVQELSDIISDRLDNYLK